MLQIFDFEPASKIKLCHVSLIPCLFLSCELIIISSFALCGIAQRGARQMAAANHLQMVKDG